MALAFAIIALQPQYWNLQTILEDMECNSNIEVGEFIFYHNINPSTNLK